MRRRGARGGGGQSRGGEASEGNHATYTRGEIVEHYASRSGLQPGEGVLIDRWLDAITGSVFLDIGVGGGRTTGVIAALTQRYVGVDYSAPLIEAARRRYPERDLRWADARDLAEFEDEEFSVVWFSFNGIDSVGDDDRRQILGEIRRVLRPGGLFLFSTHNRDVATFDRLPWRRRPRVTRTYARSVIHAVRRLPQILRMRRQVVHTADYAQINDDAHDYTLLMYYIDRFAQARQLGECGFELVEVSSQGGRPLGDGEVDRASVWLHYVARRVP
jgi:SAM-dependent methyltransferase